MRFKILFPIFCAVIFVGCSSAKKQAELLEQSKPSWVKERPLNTSYYTGIGIIPKIGSSTLYEEKARERALADIAGQINTTINSEAKFFQVEDKSGVHEYLQNRIKAVSAEYFEGYEYVDSWEDLSNYYVYYRLSKQKYLEVKERRRQEALEKAVGYYETALRLESQHVYVEAIEKYAKGIDLLSGYTNESTVTEVNGASIDLVTEATLKIAGIIKALSITGMTKGEVSLPESFEVLVNSSFPVHNIPVEMEFSGGYLVKDHFKTDEEGRILFPSLPDFTGKHTLVVSIDLINLGRQVSMNLLVRKTIESQKAAELRVVVE